MYQIPNKISTTNTKLSETSSLSSFHAQFEINEMEALFHKAILKQQADDKPFTFVKNSDVDATIIRINHIRASAEEAIKFKEFMLVNIHQGHRNFIIDLTNCEFMDSTFLGSIIVIAKKLRALNGQLTLVADPQKLKVLYTLTELSKMLNVEKTLNEAINNSLN
ncbi:MAG: STAS domain-containing protein [Ignavibacteriae bacterium]|nr:STAS domain-containing protein [Ignavibacteriota bacterium]MCB9249816.1 STAS domain-containing protein [Ignavibacteriales bacterium]